MQKAISFREPSPKVPFQIPYLKKHISLPQLQEKEVKVQIFVSSQAESKITFYQEKIKVSISQVTQARQILYAFFIQSLSSHV